MSTRTVRGEFRLNGVLTDATTVKLSDAAAAYGVKRNDTNGVVVADNTAMTKVATGQYEYTFTEPVGYTGTYTAWVEFVYGGNTYWEEGDLTAATIPSPTMACNYASLVNLAGWEAYGLRPTASDVITDGVANTYQGSDILREIGVGLACVYNAHRWSFLRPRVTLTTYASYGTGTIKVTAGGVVTGTGTVFPSYSASAGGMLSIPGVGSFAVGTYSSETSLALTAYTGGEITVATAYTLGFNTYPMPAGVDNLEGRLTYAEGIGWHLAGLRRVDETQIRQWLVYNTTPARPEAYALVTTTFDPTVGSTRSIRLYPIPDGSYVLTAIGTLRPPMIDETNQYPLGAEVLSACIVESVLAAVERDLQHKDAGNPEAVHNRAFVPLLAMAIQRDKEYSTPETLGVDHGDDDSGYYHGYHNCCRPVPIYWDGGGGFTGYL